MIEPADIPMKTGLRQDLQTDVAIVGAGVGGLYTGYRLLGGAFAHGVRPPSPPHVHVFEMSHRIGGRLESIRLPGMSITGELGGMRYLTSQAMVTTLIEQVFADRLKPTVFPMGGSGAHRFLYLRTQRFRADAWARAQARGSVLRTRYAVHPDDAGYSPDQLFNKIIYDVLMADRHVRREYGDKILHPSRYEYEFQLTRRDWAAIKPALIYNFDGPYKGMRVAEMGFWNLVRDRCGDEGYAFLSDGNGYYSMTINWNAAEAFPYTVGDFSGTSVAYKTIEGGYDQIAYALADTFVREGGTIWCGNRLVDLAHGGKGGRRYALTMENGATGRRWRVHADRVVLAMPRRSLELLNQENFFFEPDRGTNLTSFMQTALYEPSFKLLLGFREPWWTEDFGAHAGESITDLPMRQCYYFGTDPANGHSLFLASYNDMRTERFWSVLEGGPRFEPQATRKAPKSEMRELRSAQASRVMVDEAMRQVRAVHGRQPHAIPDPYVSYYRNWTDDPFGAGYHGWAAGAPVKRVMRYMRRPYAHEHVHVCGEAYSEQQGWVEGALCVAERMLQEHFGMKWPSWLDRGYFLGW